MNASDPLEDRQSQQQLFRELLLTVAGQAYQAAGYHLDSNPLQALGGLFAFRRHLDSGLTATIEYQVLVYNDTAYTGRRPSRFRVSLVRSDKAGGQPSTHPMYVRRTLSALVVEDFGVAILPSADYWWTFNDMMSLGKALAEAGHLVVGYGMPWLAGDLTP